MKRGRKTVICNSCNKDKLHFGLGKCSACLRNFKRKTKPSFYLGTCYSEMSRRCKTYDAKRPSYYGKKICTKQEFIKAFEHDKVFLELYKGWQTNNFQRKYAPSIDRIDNSKDYTIDNIEFTSHYNNSTKDVKIPVTIYAFGTEIASFQSQKECADYLNVAPSVICLSIKHNKLIRKKYNVVRA